MSSKYSSEGEIDGLNLARSSVPLGKPPDMSSKISLRGVQGSCSVSVCRCVRTAMVLPEIRLRGILKNASWYESFICEQGQSSGAEELFAESSSWKCNDWIYLATPVLLRGSFRGANKLNEFGAATTKTLRSRIGDRVKRSGDSGKGRKRRWEF